MGPAGKYEGRLRPPGKEAKSCPLLQIQGFLEISGMTPPKSAEKASNGNNGLRKSYPIALQLLVEHKE